MVFMINYICYAQIHYKNTFRVESKENPIIIL